LNQTNVDGNNNKFYRIQILEPKSGGPFQTWTRWGRVGERGPLGEPFLNKQHANSMPGQNKLMYGGDFEDAFHEFGKKFKDKTGHAWDDRHLPSKPKKYTFVERSYESDTDSDEEEQVFKGAGSRERSPQPIANDSVQSTLSPAVQRLMQLIFNAQYFQEVMADMNYDVDKLPLGKLSKRSIEQGYEQLKV
jgi:poly [ADP-ribose] polymerase